MKFTPTQLATAGVLMALATLFGCASPAAKEGNKQAVEDAAITSKVLKALSDEATLKSSLIVVETSKGVVLLSGTVDSAAAENTATELARYIDGVTLVRDGIKIKQQNFGRQ